MWMFCQITPHFRSFLGSQHPSRRTFDGGAPMLYVGLDALRLQTLVSSWLKLCKGVVVDSYMGLLGLRFPGPGLEGPRKGLQPTLLAAPYLVFSWLTSFASVSSMCHLVAAEVLRLYLHT